MLGTNQNVIEGGLHKNFKSEIIADGNNAILCYMRDQRDFL